MEVQQIFLSTLPARGATIIQMAPRPHSKISIHAPREGGDDGKPTEDRPIKDPIHAPSEWSVGY